MTRLVEVRDLTHRYRSGTADALAHVEIDIDEGEFVVVVGPTGSGKSTLLGALVGLVPHFSGGSFDGSVEIAGRNTRFFPPRDLADVVGYVAQDPAASFVADIVEDELAFTMENLGIDRTTMRRRIEETIDLMGLSGLRTRPLASLSGGEQQRVAIAAVLTAAPRLLVLDEPTSSLDPAGAEDVLSALSRLVHDVGLAVVIAEHRLERVVHLADRVVVVEAGRVESGLPAPMLAAAPVAPPVVRLGRALGWSPLPLSVRDARRSAASLRDALTDAGASAGSQPDSSDARDSPTSPTTPDPSVRVRRLRFGHDGHDLFDGLDLDITAGEITAVMGRNGAGKSTLFSLLVGARRPDAGSVAVTGVDPSDLDGPALIGRVGLVPQDPSVLLYASTVRDELRLADVEGHLEPGATAAVLTAMGVVLDPERHPRDLSAGQQLCLALAVVCAHRPSVLLLDEPTRGLDYASKDALTVYLRDVAAAGSTVIVATHDVELAGVVADRVVVLADGDVIADGSARQVVTQSPSLSPQVSRIFAPLDVLSVAEVVDLVSP